jgi:hypothetical protein
VIVLVRVVALGWVSLLVSGGRGLQTSAQLALLLLQAAREEGQHDNDDDDDDDDDGGDGGDDEEEGEEETMIRATAQALTLYLCWTSQNRPVARSSTRRM